MLKIKNKEEMKKILISLTAIILAGIIGWFSYQNHLEHNEQRIYEQKIKSISALYTSLGLQSHPSEKFIMVVYFNSECEHCHWQIEEISKNIILFKNIRMIFVSSEPESQAIDYLSKHKLESTYVNTDSENIFNTFTGGVPQILIYENEQLRKHFVGETEISLLSEFIK